MRELMSKYADRPMDLAVAALVGVAEREGIRKIFTVDRKDFSVYLFTDGAAPDHPLKAAQRSDDRQIHTRPTGALESQVEEWLSG